MPRITIAAVLLLAVGVMFTPSADAAVIATFDFVALAAGNEGPAAPSYSNNGITVDLSAAGGTPYLDDLSGGRPAGLGVCTAYIGDACDPGSDDNLGIDEMLTLTFSGVPVADAGGSYRIIAISFRDAGHTTDFGGELGGLDIDAMGFNQFSPDTGAGVLGANGIAFTFKAPINFGKNGTEQLYISSVTVSALTPGGEEVPEPGTIGLMLIGLGMLAGGRKFRNRKNS